MGCNIHLFTERKRTINSKEKWVSIDYLKLNPYFGEYENEEQFEVVELYGDRNYEMFSMLASVRNYHNNPIISEPKGFPKDCCDFINKMKHFWEGDGHSHSFFTLKELKDFRKKNKVTNYAGLMDLENANLVDKGEMPNSWCQGTNRQDYVYREWFIEDDKLGVLVERLEKRLSEEFGLPKNTDTLEHDEEVRIVFWFDN
jgi:hypothetical protein